MKFGWNKILITAMALFILMIVAMGIRMATSDQSLYETDYYQKGEAHAERMEAEKQGHAIDIRYDHSTKMLNVDFGDTTGIIEEIKGIKLSDSSEDFISNQDRKAFKTANIALRLSSGIWVLEIKGTVAGQAFFKKKQIAI